MKSGLIIYGLDRPLSGISRYALELATALGALGEGPELVWLMAGRADRLGRNDSCGTTLLRGCGRLPALLTLGNLAIPAAARRCGLDLIHDPTGVTPFLFGAGGARTVVTVHDVFAWSFPGTSTLLDTLIYRHWLPRVLPRVDVIITDSGRSREDIVTYLPVSPERVVVVPLAADRRFRPMETAEVEPVLRQYGVERPYILHVGSLESRKNLPRMLEAYGQLREWSVQWRLVIVGARRWKSSPIFDTVQQLGLEPYVQFTGYVADEHLPGLYAGSDLFVFPSLYEGFGLPPLEAMACGTPVVCSNAASLPEVVGEAAITVDPYDVEALAGAMHRVLADADLQQDLRRRGLERAAGFTWERTAQETVQVYREVLKS